MIQMKDEPAQWKVELVNQIAEMIDTYPVVAVARINGIPAKQMQMMRAGIKGSGILRVSKNNFFKKALEKSKKKNIQKLAQYIDGQVAFFFTDMNPFKLFKKMEETKVKAPAKGGEIAPADIVIEKGETPFKPGPLVGQLQKAGIPAAIQQGKIVIRKTVTPVKAGERIPRELAAMLTKLEIYPLTVGFDLRAVHQEGTIFEKSVLDLDIDQYREKIKTAVSNAFALSVNAIYPTSLTVVPILSKAYTSALNLAVNAGIVIPETLPVLISRSWRQMLSVASRLKNEALDEELKKAVEGVGTTPVSEGKEKKKEEKSPEEKKKEEEEVSEDEAVAGLGALFG